MASFNVSMNFGSFMAEQGFRVEPNKEFNLNNPIYGQRRMRLFAPEALKGKAAKKWFNKVFWACHTRCSPDRGCSCCEVVIPKFANRTRFSFF